MKPIVSKRVVSYIVLLALCSTVAEVLAIVSDAEAIASNIVWMILDDLKPTLGSFGDINAVTPHMDELARRGVRFPLTYGQLASCGPSRSSMLTSRRIDFLGSYVNNFDVRSNHDNIQTIFQVFKEEGYHVSGAGKVFDSRSFPDQDMPYSWSEQFAFTQNDTTCFDQPRSMCKDDIGCKCVLFVDPSVVFSTGSMPAIERPGLNGDEIHIDGRMTSYAITKLEEWSVQGVGKPIGNSTSFTPFLFALGFKKPHLPWTAPEEYFELYDNVSISPAEYRQNSMGGTSNAVHSSPELNSYYGFDKSDLQDHVRGIKSYLATVSYMDALIGKIVEAVHRLGFGDNTVFVLMGDHGFHLGDHGLWTKHSNFEQAVRTPLIVTPPLGSHAEWQSEKHSGAIVATPVELLDVPSTLLDIVGLLQPGSNDTCCTPAQFYAQDAHGASLRGYLTQSTDQDDPVWPSGAVKALAMSQFLRRQDTMGYAFRTTRYRYVRWIRRSNSNPLGSVRSEELYDYVVDPLESKNLDSDSDYAPIMDLFRGVWEEYESSFHADFKSGQFALGVPFDAKSANESIIVSSMPRYAPLTQSPSMSPTASPSLSPSVSPSNSPISPSESPTLSPTISVNITDRGNYTDTEPTEAPQSNSTATSNAHFSRSSTVLTVTVVSLLLCSWEL